MGDVMGPAILPPRARGRDPTPLPPPSKSYPPPHCESEVQGVLRTQRLWYHRAHCALFYRER